jgi:exopolysaccharide production protein ExoQ
MTADLATGIFVTGILGLFWLDRDGAHRVSRALWIPVVWTLIAGSRMVSEWLQPGYVAESPEVLLDGSPLDRLVLAVLLGAGLMVLGTRGPRVGAILRTNGALVLFFLYGAFSILWSDYPDVAGKRWIKACGNVVMVLIVLTEADASAALKRFLARVGFLLIPLSILLIKYYPALGRGYHPFTWQPYYGGVATGKNALGYLCLVLGLASLWRLLELRRRSRSAPGSRGVLLAHGAVLVMVLWLFRMADSITPFLCLLVAGSLMLVAGSRAFASEPNGLHFLVGTGFVVLLCGLLLFGAAFTEALGRDATLTGRTALWDGLLSGVVDPVVGAGFESFWLGERLTRLWNQYWWRPNQAHNGYLEIYLNLGAIGVLLLVFVLLRGYRNVSIALRRDPEVGRLKLAFLVAAVLYNLTEAAFKGIHLVWIASLIAVVYVPRPYVAPSEPEPDR